jgi:hypothetical protein
MQWLVHVIWEVSAAGLRRAQAKLSCKLNWVVGGRIRWFESYMPSHAVALRDRGVANGQGLLNGHRRTDNVASDVMRRKSARTGRERFATAVEHAEGRRQRGEVVFRQSILRRHRAGRKRSNACRCRLRQVRSPFSRSNGMA